MNTDLYQQSMPTAVGWLQVSASEQAIVRIEFVEQTQPDNDSPLTRAAVSQLRQYFAGQRQQFDLPLTAIGTAFQQQVWQQLCRIPYGHTCSYKEIATAIDRHKAVRAVGAANGKNPLAIVVPCHRVIGTNGTLTGYAGGLTRKAWLLQLEAQVLG